MTKQAGEFSKLDKVYEATFILGTKSSTGDSEGELKVVDGAPDYAEADILAALAKFTGKIKQKPPIFSAIKIDGQRAYKLARAGKNPEMPTREVEIYNLELVSWHPPELKVRAKVSSGTYIRSLAEDIAESLGTVAYTRELRRMRVGEYDLSELEKSARCLHL